MNRMKIDLELTVGIFIIAGIICLGYLSIRLAKMEIIGGNGYEIYAIFSDIGGLKVGSPVVIAGMDVGKIKDIQMQNYEAKVIMQLPDDIEIQEDAIASIKTRGLIGEKYLQITPGGTDEVIKPGGRIRETVPAFDMEELISKYAFGNV